jgi:hypothetical protein
MLTDKDKLVDIKRNIESYLCEQEVNLVNQKDSFSKCSIIELINTINRIIN